VNGPTTTPAKRYPTIAGSFRRVATNPAANARVSATLIVAMSSV